MTLSSVFNPQELWGLLEREKAVSAEYAASCLEDYPETEILKQLKAWEKQGKLLLDGGYYCLPPSLNPALLKKAQKALKQAKSLDAFLCCLKLNCGMDEATAVLEELYHQGKAEKHGEYYLLPGAFQNGTISKNNPRPVPPDLGSPPQTRNEDERAGDPIRSECDDDQDDSGQSRGLHQDSPQQVSSANQAPQGRGEFSENISEIQGSSQHNFGIDAVSRRGWIVYTKPGNSDRNYLEFRWYDGGIQKSKYIPGGNVLTAQSRANREEVERALSAGKSTREICELIDTFRGAKRK